MLFAPEQKRSVPLLALSRSTLFPKPVVGEIIRSRVHFRFDDSDGLFTPASRAFARPRLSAYSLPSSGATCGGSLSRYGRPIPSSFSCASIQFHKISLDVHLSARVSPFTLTRSAASPR